MAEPRNFNRALHLLHRAQQTPERMAIIAGAERIDFATLAQRARVTAGALRDLGIGAGTRVGIILPAEPEFIVVQQALLLLGATVSPLNVAYTKSDLAHAIDSCGLQAIVLHADWCDRMPAQAPPIKIAAGAVGRDLLPGYASLEHARAKARPLTDPALVAPTDVAFLLNTSATTGKSKGVMLTAGNLAANYDATPGWLGLGAEDVILCALPLFNMFGLNQGINAIMVTGACMVLLPRFDAARCIEAIGEHGCTFMPAVPTMLQKIFDHPGLRTGALRSLRRIMTGGAPVPAALLQRIVTAAGSAVDVRTGYGLTEATALVTLHRVSCDPIGELAGGKAIGRALPGVTLESMDDDGMILPRGVTGELVVRGANVMAGYFNAPTDTAHAMHDGWLRTGDIGFLDTDGLAWIVDRKKDVIIRGGQNIYPVDIEEVIYAIDGISEVAVVAQPDAVLGEVPVAFVATRPGCTLSDDQVLAHCVAHLARYKWPSAVRFLDELPKGSTGKILRRTLRDRAASLATAS